MKMGILTSIGNRVLSAGVLATLFASLAAHSPIATAEKTNPMPSPPAAAGSNTSFEAAARDVADASSKTVDISAYGGEKPCVNDVDQTAYFQAAATAAANLYARTGKITTITYSGNCTIKGSVTYGSGVAWEGSGSITVPTGTQKPVLLALSADHVSWKNVDITFTKSYGASIPTANGIAWMAKEGDSVAHKDVKVIHCAVHNAAWGILIWYDHGTGSLSDVEIANSTVDSPAPYSNWDGIHVAGPVSNVRVHDNTVKNRDDGAISFTAEYVSGVVRWPTGVTIQHNTVTQDRVGIDLSGAEHFLVIENYVVSTTTSKLVSPALRCIVYNTRSCINGEIKGNTFQSGPMGVVSGTVSLDTAGSNFSGAANVTVEDNTIISSAGSVGLYLRGNNVSVTGNTFSGPGSLVIDYYEMNCAPNCQGIHDVSIGRNRWLSTAYIQVAGNASFVGNLKLASQDYHTPPTILNAGNLTLADGNDGTRRIR